MRRYLRYFKYLYLHKYHVFRVCLKLKVPFLRALFHDWDKLSPRMIRAYANFFYNEDGSDKQKKDDSGYYNPFYTGDEVFDYARASHLQKQPHHWQYWCISESLQYVRVLRMPETYVREMVADWIGAGLAQKSKGVKNWYCKNKTNIILHIDTRELVEKLIEEHG